MNRKHRCRPTLQAKNLSQETVQTQTLKPVLTVQTQNLNINLMLPQQVCRPRIEPRHRKHILQILTTNQHRLTANKPPQTLTTRWRRQASLIRPEVPNLKVAELDGHFFAFVVAREGCWELANEVGV